MEFSTDVWINFVTMFLIISGGIGFIVIWDLMAVFSEAVKKRKFRHQIFERLTLHSKVAIATSVCLIFVGTVLFFAFEFKNSSTIGDYSLGEKLLTSLFQSVSSRTAGFVTVTQDSFRMHTYLIIMLLILIGGSPMSTSGGLKTTTVAMMFFCVKSVVKGKKDTEVFNRRIVNSNIKTGLTVIVLFMTMLISGIIALSITDDFSGLETIFECVSAIGTTGFSTGITPMLSLPGKIIILLLMFIGRIGPVTIVMAISGKNSHKDDTRQLAHKRIIVG